MLMSRSDLVLVRFTCLPFLCKAGHHQPSTMYIDASVDLKRSKFSVQRKPPLAFEHIKVMDYLLPSSKYQSSMSEYPHPAWPFFGETSAPPVPMPQFASSPGNSPRPWGSYNRNPFQNTSANNPGSVGPQGPPVSHSGIRFIPFLFERRQGNVGYEANARPCCQGLSGILKTFISHRMAHPDSEVVAFHTENGTNGKKRVTVTFETNDEE